MMYKVLLADDEILDLEGMRTFIPWKELGLEVIAAVNNGFSACKVLEKEAVDILVTDVQMPNMSGLELARTALEKSDKLRVIFVSGYQDFHYVKQALSLNAISYVLKPMDDKELIDSLVKTKQDLDREQKMREAEQAFKQISPIAQNEYILQLIEGSLAPDTLPILTNIYGMDTVSWPVRVAILETNDLSWKLNPYNDKEKQEILHAFSGKILSLCRQQDIRYVCKIAKHRIALLMEYQVPNSVLEDMISYVKAKLPFTITIGLGGEVNNLPSLQESYRQAIEALDHKMFHGKEKIIHSEEIHSTEVEEIKNLDIRLASLFSAMSNNELVRINDEIEELFEPMMGLKSKLTIHIFSMYIILKFDGYLHTLHEDLFQILGMELKNLDILYQFETIDDIRSWLRRKAFEISEMLYTKMRNKNWKRIDEMLQYMQQNINNSNMTLRDISDHFSFSPNYLGHMFKEQTGKSFSEFMIMLRMKKACELLKDSKVKIYEVADRVGYRYLPYFSRQFKETYGVTPVEFRRQN